MPKGNSDHTRKSSRFVAAENRALTETAVRIGAAMGKADRSARQLARFGSKEFASITKALRLARLKRTARRIRRSLA